MKYLLNSSPTLLFAMVTASFLSACGQPANNTTADTTEKTTETAEATASSSDNTTNEATATSGGTFKVGSDLTFPPYEYLEGDTPKGFDIELMDAIASNAGMKTDYMDTRFTNLMSGLDSNKYDAVISAIYLNEDRLKKYDMIPYFTTDEVLVVKSDSTYKPKGAMDLCGHTISAMKGTLLAEQLNDMSKNKCEAASKEGIKVREFATSPEALQALLAGSVEAHYDDIALGNAAVEKLAGKVVISSSDSFYPIVGGIVVRKGDAKTYEFINTNLKAVRESGKYGALLKQYGLTEANDADVADIKAKVGDALK